MIYDDILSLLRNCKDNLSILTQFWQSSGVDDRLATLERITHHEDFWQNKEQASILKELESLKDKTRAYTSLNEEYVNLNELASLYSDDEETLKTLIPEVRLLSKSINRLKTEFLLSGSDDESPCFLTVNSGAGGTESQDWAEILLRMYVRFCEREKFTYTVVDMQVGEGAGIKSATLYIKGKNTYGLLKNEQGIHRLVRISPFDSNKRRHTSFAAIFVSPEVTKAPIVINPDDLRIDTYRAGGAGGQHVNKTDSAVRITHIPSGIVVQCQNERSQMQNKETAMKMLFARLVQKQKEEDAAKQQAIERKKIEWGSQIRSYILHPYKLIKDHRTDYESTQPEDVLDGDLMGFIQAELLRTACS